MKKVLLLVSILSTALISGNVSAAEAEAITTPQSKLNIPQTPATVIMGQRTPTPEIGVEDAPQRRQVQRNLGGIQGVARRLFS
tara:strand:+ start:67873 stop:68121 length:249 start_codon:yes stop_codon:yes gene_type:complete